jgi:enoyl-CoA hydratase/carnithine racemase
VETSAQEVCVTRTDHVLHIRLNRPDKRNALSRSMYEAMADAVALAEMDEAIRVVLFSGAGEAFCAGNDLHDFLAHPPEGTEGPAFRFLRTICSATKVQVGAVHGNAVGVGTTLLLHCDLIIAGQSARFSLPFVKMGLIPEAASTLLLPRAIGYCRAAELLLLGETVDATTALQWGLVNRVVEDPMLMEVAQEFATRVGIQPPATLRITKTLLRDDRAGIAQRLEQEGRIFAAQLKSPEAKETVTAVLEKRPPDFSRFT